MCNQYKPRAIVKFKCPIRKCVILHCVKHNFLTGVLLCNNKIKSTLFHVKENMYNIYLYNFFYANSSQ